MPTPHELLVANLKFNSGEELALSLSTIERYVAEHTPTELDLRLHWQKHLLTPEYHRLASEVMKRLVADHNGLPLYSFLPECFEDKLGITCFPNCDHCALFEAKWCKWPRQFTDKYYRTPQRNLASVDFRQLKEIDFTGTEPVTWFTPSRQDIALLAELFRVTGRLVDFGCGSGFVSSLLLAESEGFQIEGVDPFALPQLKHSHFVHTKELPVPGAPWALLSCLSDYHVPVEKCFKGDLLPEVAAFVVFPEVFGRGGERIVVEVRGERLEVAEKRELFSFSKLDSLGYELGLRRPVRSAYYQDCELRIYLKDRLLLRDAVARLKISSPYPWENCASRSAMSTESFA